MAIGATKGGGMRPGGTPVVIPGSAHGVWVTANDDCRTAQTAAMLYNPSSITDSTFHWIRVPYGTTRALIRGKVAKATTAVGTSPVVRVVGAYDVAGGLADCSGVADGTVEFLRLDAATWAATGLTLTFPASPSTTNCYNDTTYFYSDVASLTPIDLLGANWVGVPVVTASATTASAAVLAELCFIN